MKETVTNYTCDWCEESEASSEGVPTGWYYFYLDPDYIKDQYQDKAEIIVGKSDMAGFWVKFKCNDLCFCSKACMVSYFEDGGSRALTS